MKCDALSCWYCTLHPKRVEGLSWLPDPILTDGGTDYSSFSQVYGKETTDADKPTLKEKLVPSENDKQNRSVLVAGKISSFT